MAQSWLSVSNIPEWIRPVDLLGKFEWKKLETSDENIKYEAKLDQTEAALVQARLRGIVIDGKKIICQISPKLKRAQERAGSLEDARQRRDVSVGFSKSGAKLDKEGQFSLTPETIALNIGNTLNHFSVIDACCGAGGNTIGFARSGCQVTAFELNSGRINDAKYNSKLYDCENKITFVLGDFLKNFKDHSAEVLWIDPPWGDYDKYKCGIEDFTFLAEVLNQVDLKQFKRTLIKLPQAFDTSTLPDFNPTAVFGVESGDLYRIKFLLLEKKS